MEGTLSEADLGEKQEINLLFLDIVCFSEQAMNRVKTPITLMYFSVLI